MLLVDIAAHSDTIVSALRGDGWCHIPQFLSAGLVGELRADLFAQRERFVPAAIGRVAARQHLPQQRGDATLWLNGDGAVQREFLALLDGVRQQLNRQLLLGLIDCEAHYAHYAPDQFYRRHLDVFRVDHVQGLPQRIVSSVFYLNDDWRAEHGGELLLWREDDELVRIAPRGGSAVFFLSAEFPHEVLPASVDRYSIAGWFRNRGVGA